MFKNLLVIASIILIYMSFQHLFSYKLIKEQIENTLTISFGRNVVLGRIIPRLLWGFVVEGLEINSLRIDQKFKVYPHPLDLITGTLGFGFSTDLNPNGGRFEGSLRLPSLTSKGMMKIRLSLDNVDISKLSAFFPEDARPSGIISGKLSFVSPVHSFNKAKGSLDFTWLNGILPLPYDGIPFDALAFDTFSGGSNIDKGILTIEEAVFTGQTPGRINGSIILSDEVKTSRMNITGEMILPPSLNKELGIKSISDKPSEISLMGILTNMRFRVMTPLGSPIIIASKHKQHSSISPTEILNSKNQLHRMTHSISKGA